MASHQQIVSKSLGTFEKLIPGFLEVCYSCIYLFLNMIGCCIVIEPVTAFLIGFCHASVTRSDPSFAV